MRSSVRTLLLALLLAAGHSSGSVIEPQLFEKGTSTEIFVATFPDTVSRCFLITPSGNEVDILASETLPERYEYVTNFLSDCRVRINDLDRNDEGLWSLHAVLSTNEGSVYELKEQANIYIKGSEKPEANVSEESDKHEASISSEESVSTEGTDKPEASVSEESDKPEESVSSEGNDKPEASVSEESDKPEESVSSEVSDKPEGSVKPEESVSSEGSDKPEGSVKPEEGVSSEESSKLSAEETIRSSEETADSEVLSSESSKVSAEDGAASVEISEEEVNTISSEKESLEASSSEEKLVVTQWLSDLKYITRTGLNVDINLPPTLNNEKCTLTKPDNTTVDVGDGIPGVTARRASDYVSCRVLLGPMEPSLLGKWTLCGSYEENDVEHRRCQNADVVWRSTSNPDSMWQTTINAKFDHVVHFGGTLAPGVRGSGSVVSCHLVTPDDEDLFVTRDREYPNVTLMQDTDSACSIAIGPIAASHLGDWAVYGTFDSAVWGYNEVRLPFNMELYNKDDPYDQAYNVTTLNPAQHVVNLGSTIPVEVTSTGDVDVCQFTMPTGQTYLSTGPLPSGVSFVNNNRIACQLSIGPITDNMLGDWLLVGKFSNRGVYTENRLTFTIIQEDPSNPIEEDRTVQNLDEQFFDTNIGASHRITLASDIFSTSQSCHIRTPEGLQYTIMEGFNIPGVEVETGSHIFCGVTVRVSEDHIGTWTLISREIRSSQAVERRLPFIIYVEESVEAVPNEITITEGNSIHVRLAEPTALYETCKLNDPSNQQALATLDTNNVETCGFIVSSVDANHNGTWNIVYGTKIIYKAPVHINVNARVDLDVLHLIWVEHTSVNLTMGPEEAVYCRVFGPRDEVVYDGFGRCHVTVDRVMMDQHAGVWAMNVGLPGHIMTETQYLEVQVTVADKKPEVSSSVSTNKPIVELTCAVTSKQQKTGCLFRSPVDAVLVANQGVREGRYAFHVNQTSVQSDSYYYGCSLHITEPLASDLGLWRCDLESEEENYYGFLTVLSPWVMQDPAVADTDLAQPVLKARIQAVSVEEHEPATLACTARAQLRYCYFRAPNGTIFNVQPGMSSPAFEYIGAGLDAGECGVRLRSLAPSDGGTWSCHASVDGLEHSRSISVRVQDEFIVRSSRDTGRLVIEGRVGGNRPLDYCRFVRFDGFGFASDSPPFPYMDESNLSSGLCRLRVAFSLVDLHPWTVVTKLQGRAGEISRVTSHNWPAPAPIYYNSLFMWLPMLMIVSGCLLMAGALAPAQNRRWAAARATRVRASMRDGWRASLRRFPGLRKTQPTDTNPAA